MSTHQAGFPLCQSRFSMLLIIDAQERIAAAMPEEELAETVTNINRLSRSAQYFDIPIIWAEQNPKGLGRTVEAIRQHLPADATPTEKNYFSSCTAPGFERALTQEPDRKQVVLVGMDAHIGVVQTASGLRRWGYQVFIAEDAICCRRPALKLNALERMRHCGLQVTNAESVVFEWLGDSSHERFKDILALFR
ncbi:nicotinamidase-like amidase [Thioflavicoccus mobilis 8321]|uniref:Nicotinamidase-like amidase n=1 Tax=Thioflavicoccus mobilis 8321 TaxID=765912 RepID=L0GZ41_9GAMM|nr:isochorismatase family protein [Thioflavicoccus mobilis]AGA91102.1 nicotinamidase-like amidase [Thioflavicoccus mobilis 8321]